MTADDTSREALIERVENLLMDERDKYPRVHNDAPSADLAEAVVDAVVMPLVQERDAAIKRAEAAEAELERLHSWRGLLSLMDEHWPENVFPTLTDDPARDTGPRLLSALRRADAAEVAHKALTEAVQDLADTWEDDARPVAGRIVTDIRALLDEHGATR